MAINATRQLVDFKQFCEFYPVLLIDDLEIIETACKIQVDLKSRGHRLEDADILIAATAIARGLILVSHDSDLQRIQELTIKLAIIAVVNILNAHATYRKISTSAPLLTASSARCKTSSLTTALK
ncbi:PIN domain-containing protein [Aulosira sp. FACHB-615]|uniref:PIN domain-containing protein n=1 Tax=Aulosira sp. FACHB-615 TaxID=2692777 RepID=UPI0037C0EDE9